MKYLIILFTLITISSCCKKVDGVCCDDGVYVRFENQTEYEINTINFYSIEFNALQLNKSDLTMFYDINKSDFDSSSINTVVAIGVDKEGNKVYGNNPASFEDGHPQPLNFSFHKGCYTIQLNNIDLDGPFSSDNLSLTLIEN